MAESITRAAVVKKIAQQVLKYLPDYYEGSEKFKFIPAQEILQISEFLFQPKGEKDQFPKAVELVSFHLLVELGLARLLLLFTCSCSSPMELPQPLHTTLVKQELNQDQ